MKTTAPASIATHFSQLQDPRRDHGKLHSLHDILVLSICATICGADGFAAIEEYGHAKEQWLRSFLDLDGGIPSHDTIGRVFSLIATEEFEACFLAWMQGVFEATDGEVVALDGKRLRRSYDRASGKAPLHMVGAWATENRLLLGGLATEDKSNEITALPSLIALLDLKGCIVTIDAAGCQREVARRILEQEANYVLTLKENQGSLYADVAALFARVRLPEEPTEGVVTQGVSFAQEIEGDHGRIETRRCWALPVAERGLIDLEGWSGLSSVVLIERRRELTTASPCSTGDISLERRYYISSLAADAGALLRVVRRHWQVENRLHWVLDVVFSEDQSRIRSGYAAANLALVRRLAVSALQRERSLKRGIAIKRLRAGWDEDYLFKVLRQL